MIRIAQIGVGYWGPNLLRNLMAHRDIEVTCVAEASPERRDYVNQAFNVRNIVNSAEEAIARDDVDAVIIASPASTHSALAQKALEANKHILVEKPLCMHVAEIDALEAIAKPASLTVMAGHTFLYNPAVLHLRKIIEQGELGELRYIYTQRLNLGQIRSDVDALWNLAPHDISIIQYLLGDVAPSSVVRSGMTYIQEGIEDVTFLNITYPEGIMANVHVSWLDPRKTRTVVVVGSRKMAVYDDLSEYQITVYDKSIEPDLKPGSDYDQPPHRFVHNNGAANMPSLPKTEPLKAEIDHFISCIHDGTEPRTGITHARNVVGILERASKAAGT